MHHPLRLVSTTAATLVAALVAAVFLPAGAHAAATEPRVISGVHTDLVSVGVTDGWVTLGSTAAVDGELEKILDPAATIFNVESASRITLGRGSNLPFLGDLGNEFWIAPQSNPEGALLWPGVSTESIDAGVLDNDDVSVSLTGVDGPGFVSVYQTDSFGSPIQLLDSRAGTAFTTWPLKAGQHQHANWAFSAAGDYTLTVTATANIGGVPQSVVQDYHIVVGNMVPATETTLSAPIASATTLPAGTELTLHSTITPLDARGTVSFFSGTHSLGDADLIDGVATLTTSTVPVGRQTISARFFPESSDDFAESVSSPTVVTVTPAREDGSFAIAPLNDSYTDGETVTLTAIGDRPADGENYQWVMRMIGTELWEPIYDDLTYRSETGATFTRVLTTDYNGWEIALQIQKSHLVLAQSAAVAPSVTGPSVGTGLEVAISGIEPLYRYGEYAELTVTGAALPAGARYEWFYYYPRSTDPFHPIDFGDPDHLDQKTFYVPDFSILPIGVRIIGEDGHVVGTSQRYTLESAAAPQLELEGIKTFYNPGDEISVTAHITPEDSPFTTYQWSLYSATGETSIIEGETHNTVTLPATLDLNKSTISVALVEPTRGDKLVGYAGAEIIVLDPDAADQIYFNPLARHYHSGDQIKLHLVSSSASNSDTYRWYLKRTDQSDYVIIPGATGTDHALTAEVALAGAYVRAELVNAQGDVVAEAEPTHIAVDDHGNPPARELSVAADGTSYLAGDTAILTATATPASLLDRYEWWVQKTADAAQTLLDVTRTNTIALPLDSSFDGAEIVARLTKETGETYSESPSMSVKVVSTAPSPQPSPEPTPVPTPTPTPTPTPVPTPTPGPVPIPGDGDSGPIVWDVPNLTPTTSGAVILNDGHVDIASIISNDSLLTQVKDTSTSSTAVYREMGDTVFQLTPDARATLPDSSTYAFLGEPGASVWQAGQTQKSGILWPGWSTELIAADATQSGVQWTLNDVTGPGEFALYASSATDLGGVDVMFNTRDGIDEADSYSIPKSTHAHGTWSFSSEGVYCLAFSRSATLTSGTAVNNDFVVAFAVGETAVTDIDPGECFTVADGAPSDGDTTPVQDESLTGDNSGVVRIVGDEFRPGQLVTANVGIERSGQWVSPWLHPAPTWFGWHQVSSAGEIQVRLPSTVAHGDHTLVVKDRSGDLLGWDTLSVIAAPVPGGDSDGDTGGESGDAENGTGGGIIGGGGVAPGASGPTAPIPASHTVAPTQCVAGATILSSGHIDYASRVVNGKLESLIKDGTAQATAWREPSSTVLWLKPESKLTLPSGYGAVGSAGSSVYQVPQTQNANLIWLGWNTESLTTALASSDVSWTLNSVNGPGRLHVYTKGSFGGVEDMIFANGGTHSIELGKHVHGNWAFSAEGIYRLSFTQSVTLANGQTSSDTETLTIAVGNVDPKTAITSSAGCGALPNDVVLASEIAAADAEAAEAAAAAASTQAAAAAQAQADAEAAAAAEADAADSAPGTGHDVGGAAEENGVIDPFAALTDGNPVPLLLYALGGLLVVGALTAGGLWWRQRRWESAMTAPSEPTDT